MPLETGEISNLDQEVNPEKKSKLENSLEILEFAIQIYELMENSSDHRKKKVSLENKKFNAESKNKIQDMLRKSGYLIIFGNRELAIIPEEKKCENIDNENLSLEKKEIAWRYILDSIKIVTQRMIEKEKRSTPNSKEFIMPQYDKLSPDIEKIIIDKFKEKEWDAYFTDTRNETRTLNLKAPDDISLEKSIESLV